MSFDKILLVKESGSFQSTATVSPSIPNEVSFKPGANEMVLISGADSCPPSRQLEKVTYKFTKHYFSGIQEWNLVLQADKATEREGPFSSNATFPNAWYYFPTSSSNPLIELPG